MGIFIKKAPEIAAKKALHIDFILHICYCRRKNQGSGISDQ
jgi:hypothetical protein